MNNPWIELIVKDERGYNQRSAHLSYDDVETLHAIITDDERHTTGNIDDFVSDLVSWLCDVDNEDLYGDDLYD